MPRKSYKKKAYTKKRTKKRSSVMPVSIVSYMNGAMGANIPRNIMPKTFTATFRNSDFISLNQTVPGLIAFANIRGNSVFDPFVGGSPYPRGIPNFLGDLASPLNRGLYRACTVVSSKLTVCPVFNGPTAGGLISILKRQVASASSNLQFDDMIEDRYATWQLITNQNTGTEPKTISSQMNMSSFLGIKPLLSNTAVRHQYATQPAKQTYYTICWHSQSPTLAGGVGVVACTVICDYKVTFTEPITLDE